MQTDIYHIRKNTIQTEDSYIQFGQLSHDEVIYDVVAKHSHKLYPNILSPGAIYESEFVLDQEAMNHIRIAYSFMDVLGDIAGLFELFVTIFGIAFLSISKHSMTLHTIKKLFMVKTSDKQLFNHKHKERS